MPAGRNDVLLLKPNLGSDGPRISGSQCKLSIQVNNACPIRYDETVFKWRTARGSLQMGYD